MRELPTGTVTFLLTDLEGSTRLWEEHPDAMRDALARHDEILHAAIAAQGGVVFSDAYGNRTILLARAGRYGEAVADARAAIDLIERDQERNTYRGALTHLSIGLAELGSYEGAATLYSAAETMLPIAAEIAFGWPRVRDRVVDALGTAAFEAATARGTLLDRDEALAFLATELDAVDARLANNA